MSAYAHEDDKSKVLLGETSDLSGIGDGTAFNGIKTLYSQLRANGKSFQFGYSSGNYGYYIDGTFFPFKTTHTATLTPTTRGTTDMGQYHSYRYVNTSSVPNSNTETYTLSSVGTKDLGATNSYRYIKTSGLMVTPTASRNITANGTFDVKNYANAVVNVSPKSVIRNNFTKLASSVARYPSGNEISHTATTAGLYIAMANAFAAANPVPNPPASCSTTGTVLAYITQNGDTYYVGQNDAVLIAWLEVGQTISATANGGANNSTNQAMTGIWKMN